MTTRFETRDQYLRRIEKRWTKVEAPRDDVSTDALATHLLSIYDEGMCYAELWAAEERPGIDEARECVMQIYRDCEEAFRIAWPTKRFDAWCREECTRIVDLLRRLAEDGTIIQTLNQWDATLANWRDRLRAIFGTDEKMTTWDIFNAIGDEIETDVLSIDADPPTP